MTKTELGGLLVELGTEGISGLQAATIEYELTEHHYLEITSPFGSDMVLHLFAFPDDAGDWPPPPGTTRLSKALTKMKEEVKLSAAGDWCEISWEPDGLPEYLHRAVRKAEHEVGDWLKASSIAEDRITGAELLDVLQKKLFGNQPWTWFQKRMVLLNRLRNEALGGLMTQLGSPMPQEITSPTFAYFADIPTVKPGSWFISIFQANELVLDRSVVIQGLLRNL